MRSGGGDRRTGSGDDRRHARRLGLDRRIADRSRSPTAPRRSPASSVSEASAAAVASQHGERRGSRPHPTMTYKLEPGAQVATRPDAPAVIMADSGEVVTYGELDERSKRLAQLFHAGRAAPGRSHGHPAREPPPVLRGRSGARSARGSTSRRSTGTSRPTRPATSSRTAAPRRSSRRARSPASPPSSSPTSAAVTVRLVIDGTIDGFEPLRGRDRRHPAEPLADEVEGTFMFYSSGTTGRPKGIKPALDRQPFGAGGGPLIMLIQRMYGFTRRHRLPLPGAAVPRRAARLVDRRAAPRRHGRRDGEVRSRRAAWS